MRYKFGENWLRFLQNVDKKNFANAKNSLKFILSKKNNKSFVDVGCGSGLFSLSATYYYKRILSLDIDDNSLLATKTLKKTFKINSKKWRIKKGSVLNKKFLKKIGKFDMVYCWGVAHHTGDMWKALENLKILTKKNSRLFIAIYNDQGIKSKIWWMIKIIYNFLPNFLRKFYLKVFELLYYINYTIKNFGKLDYKKLRKQRRGMNFWENLDDWIGGYPYEYSSVEKLNNFFIERGFKLLKVKKSHGSGCNEILFERKK